jgi:hypothetical protein
MANFKDGIIMDGKILGSAKDGIICKGTYGVDGEILGYVKDGIIGKGTYGVNGQALGTIKDGIVYKGTYGIDGVTLGRVSDFRIEGMEGEPEALMIASYHFLVKNIF